MSIDFTLDGGVATIAINRPEKHNAMDAEHYQGLSDAWTRVRDDADIRTAIITGAGEKSFTAGADLKTFAGRQEPFSDLWLTQRGQLLNRGLEVWKPVICAVNGLCFAGGMTLLFATDIRVAVDTATFEISEVKRGLLAANGGTQRALRQLPHAIAMEMLLVGSRLTAEQALQFGLINKVVPREQLMDAAMDYAHRIAANGPLAVQATKELAIRSQDIDIATGLRLEQIFARTLRTTADAAEGRAAFAEKRTPVFTGE